MCYERYAHFSFQQSAVVIGSGDVSLASPYPTPSASSTGPAALSLVHRVSEGLSGLSSYLRETAENEEETEDKAINWLAF